jgi:UDP-N-acetylmuramyl pentapeptide phosphotransferase/UDP-N-acetylglucosamine-1-phosphate transferase
MTRFSVAVATLGLVLAAFILRGIRKESVRVEYSLVWLSVVIVFVGLVLSTDAMGWIQGLVGLDDSPMVVMLLALVLISLVSLHYARILSRLRDDNIALVQRVAILQLRVQELEKRTSE